MTERVPAGGPYRALSGMHEPLVLESVREARRLVSIYCQQPEVFCEQFVSIVSRAAEKIARVRVEDLLEARDYKGLDLSFFATLKKLLEVYAKYISGLLVTWNEYVIVQFLASTEIGGRVYERGEITILPLHEASLLNVIGLIKVFETSALLELKKSTEKTRATG
ncbi:MAG: hypothetical protein QXS85_00835 [Acidilobaceae archaeon]